MTNQSNEAGEHPQDTDILHSKLEICAVTDGEILSIKDVPDDLFSQKMIGDGFAMMPTSETVYAPVSGKLIEVADAKHAYYIETDRGVKILIHIGIDTLLLNGEGFHTNLSKNSHIEKGQVLVTFNKHLIIDRGFQPIIPVIVLEHPEIARLEVVPAKEAIANKTIALTVIFKS